MAPPYSEHAGTASGQLIVLIITVRAFLLGTEVTAQSIDSAPYYNTSGAPDVSLIHLFPRLHSFPFPSLPLDVGVNVVAESCGH